MNRLKTTWYDMKRRGATIGIFAFCTLYSVLCTCGPAAATVLDTFTNYTYFYDVTVSNCTTSTDISVTMSNLSSTPGLKSWGYVRDDLKDLRVAYNHPTNGWMDIPRNVNAEVVSFACYSTFVSSTTGSYVVYFGHATESGTPTDYTLSSMQTETFGATNFASWATIVTGGSGTVTKSGGLGSFTRGVDADSAAMYRTSALSRSGVWAIEARGKWDNDGGALISVYHKNGTPSPDAWATEHYRIRNVTVQAAVDAGQNIVYVQYRDSGGTLQFWTGTAWTATATYLNLGELSGSSYARGRIESNGTQVRLIVYKNNDTTVFTTTSWVNWSSVYNGGVGYYDYAYIGDTANDWWHGTFTFDYFSYLYGLVGTREVAKQNRVTGNSRTLDSSQEVNDTTIYAYGADQATGRQEGILFVPTQTGDMQYFEVLARQCNTTDIAAHDITWELWSVTTPTTPSAYIARGTMSSLVIEKSTGAYQWQPVFFPSKVTTSASTTYALIPFVNGVGSATQAICFGADSVASGGSVVYRTRSASAWGSWTHDDTKKGAIRVKRGWPALPGRRVSVTSRTGTKSLAATGVPLWEACKTGCTTTDAGDPPDSQALYISEATYTASTWRALYSSYTTSVDTATQYHAYIGAASGPTLTSLTAYNQDPLITGPTTTETMFWTPTVYDWTASNYKGYFRNYYYPSGVGSPTQYRRLHHMTNTHANWYQPGSGGGWADDGAVTYPWPTVSNILSPKAWMEGASTYVQIAMELSNGNGSSRTIIAEKDGTTSLKNGKPIYIDLTDFGYSSAVANGIMGGHSKTSDGYYHSMMTGQEQLTGDSAGGYIFNGWVASSLDKYIYAPPYRFLERNSGLSGEYLGADPSAAVGIVGDGYLLYAAINRYGASDLPLVDGRTNIATVQVLSVGQVKTVNGHAHAQIKTVDGHPAANIATSDGIQFNSH